MTTPSKSKSRLGKELDAFVVQAILEFVFLILQLAFCMFSGL